MYIKTNKHFTYRFMPMIILSYLFINLYLIMIGSSWCKSEGCEISKSLLLIDQTDLYTLAIAAFGILMFVGIKILQTDSAKLKEFYKFSIFTIMICETILLSYLYFKTGSLCISCFIFYLLVILNYLLIDIKSKKVYVIPFIIASFALLDLNVNTISNESLSNKYTLLQSSTCKHCKEVKEYLKTNNIEYKKEEYSKYSGLFSSLNITKIPVMIVKNNENNVVILNGVSEILQYMKTNESVVIENKTINITSHAEIFSLEEEKEGCEIDFLKKGLENCEK